MIRVSSCVGNLDEYCTRTVIKLWHAHVDAIYRVTSADAVSSGRCINASPVCRERIRVRYRRSGDNIPIRITETACNDDILAMDELLQRTASSFMFSTEGGDVPSYDVGAANFTWYERPEDL